MNSIPSTMSDVTARRRFTIVFWHAASLVVFCCGTPIGAADPSDGYRFTTPRQGDAVRAAVVDGATLFAIRSERGIGEATIERRGERWPETVVVRLHLRGLEYFTIAAGDRTIGLAVSSTGDGPPVRQWLGDREREPLDKRNPLWIELRRIGADGRPSEAIPLRDGYFELRLPAELMKSNPDALRLHWIDFYR